MTKIDMLNREGSSVGEIELNDAIFMNQINVPIMHQAVRVYLASLRRGTHSTKNRAAVSGGGKKPWRQKGTGRARSGSTRSPIWVGGGTTFGPQPRSYAKKMPRKARRLAIRCALSAKVAAGELIVVEGLSFDAPKTKNVVTMLSAFDAADKKALLITDGSNENVELSSRNIPKVTALSNGCLNCFDLLHNNKVFLAKDAVAKIEEVLA